MQDHLLGRLSADPAQVDGVELFFDEVAHLDIGNLLLGFGHDDLEIVVFEFAVRHDLPAAKRLVIAAHAIDGDARVDIFLETLLRGRRQRAFQRLEHHFACHVLFACQRVDQQQDFTAHRQAS